MIRALNLLSTRLRRAIGRALIARQLRSRLIIFFGGFYLLTLLTSLLLLAPALVSVVDRQARTDVEAAGVVISRLWSMQGGELRRAAEVTALDFGFREAIRSGDAATMGSALENVRLRLAVERAYFIPPEGEVVVSSADTGGWRVDQSMDIVGLLDSAEKSSGVIEIGDQLHDGAFAAVMTPDFRGWLLIVEPLDTDDLQRSADLANLPITLSVVPDIIGPPEDSSHWSDWSLVVRQPIDTIGSADLPGYALRLSYPIEHAIAPYAAPIGAIVGVGVFGALAFLWGCALLARMFTSPITALAHAVGKLEAGQQSAVEIEGADEVAQLGRMFNSMSTEILARERDLKTLLDEQSRLYREASASDRAKSEFIATMSHELRTPLHAIIQYGEIIREELAKGIVKNVDHDASRVLARARDLLRLINDVLEVAKIEARKIEVEFGNFDVGQLVQSVVETMAPAAAANEVRFDVKIDDNAGMACTDEFRLRQCLLNLMSNAVKFSRGGSVKVTTTRRCLAGGGEQLLFEVTDTGIGMTAEQLDKLFKPFVQAEASTTRRFGGSGLGLYIVRGLVRALGGDISVMSTPGKGTSFVLTVPAEPGAANCSAPVQESAAPHAA